MRMCIVERPLLSFVVIHLKISIPWFVFLWKKVLITLSLTNFSSTFMLHMVSFLICMPFFVYLSLSFDLSSGDLSSFEVEFFSKFDVVVVSCCSRSAKVLLKLLYRSIYLFCFHVLYYFMDI